MGKPSLDCQYGLIMIQVLQKVQESLAIFQSYANYHNNSSAKEFTAEEGAGR